MVSIDYRLEYRVTKEQIFEMLRSIGYNHIKNKTKSVKKGDKWIPAEEFTKVAESGRVHIFVEFSTKSSGTEAYPQIDIHAHYDHFKNIRDKEFHVTRRSIKKDLREMFAIHDALKIHGYGYMEYKSLNSAHNTFKSKFRPLLDDILKKDYRYDTDGKYKKAIPDGQITFQIIEQRRFSHTVCVYAIGIKHDLFRDNAFEESDKIMEQLAQSVDKIKQSQPIEMIKNLEIKNSELLEKSKVLKEERNSLNLKTQEIISSIKEIQEQINREKNAKNKQSLMREKRKREKKLIGNKKLADEKHEEYLQFKKEATKVKKRLKKRKK